jgi:hypothetical protein
MKFVYSDGGRKQAGYKGVASDCVVRAIAIVTNQSYQQVYDAINILSKSERITKNRLLKLKSKSSSRNGVYKSTYYKYLKSIGYEWVSTMYIGSGCKVHLKSSELPSGRLIVKCSKHLTSVIDGVIYDTYDPSRNETRCVYGYWGKNN